MVDCVGLENRSASNGTVGSNPSLSAKFSIPASKAGIFCTTYFLSSRATKVRLLPIILVLSFYIFYQTFNLVRDSIRFPDFLKRFFINKFIKIAPIRF